MSQFPDDVEEFLSYPEDVRVEALRLLRDVDAAEQAESDHASLIRVTKGPNAGKSAGPAAAANATPGPTMDTLGVAGRAETGKILPFDAVPDCPLCSSRLDAEGACAYCKVQFVGITTSVAARTDFTPPPSDRDDPPTYRSYWDMDDDGCAIICFQSQSTGWRVWLPCFINYLDHFRAAETRFPFWIRATRLSGRTVQILADLTDEQMKERAAHIAGRTNDHQRWYDTDSFLRSYYWKFMDSHIPRQTREKRKAIIASRHRRANCFDPSCQKQHRVESRTEE